MFAKLPDCHKVPELQFWIMHREGMKFSETEKSIRNEGEIITDLLTMQCL